MSEVINNNLNQQVYTIHNSDALLNQVDKVFCVLLPRGVLIAGFSDRGDLLMIRYSDYKPDLPIWILDFFEHQFINEPLLTDSTKVTAVFIASDKSYIVPDTLYSEETAQEWLKKLYYIEINETIATYPLRDDKAVFVYAWASAIESLVNRYFTKAKFSHCLHISCKNQKRTTLPLLPVSLQMLFLLRCTIIRPCTGISISTTRLPKI